MKARAWLLALGAALALTSGVHGQGRPPAQKTGPITMYGVGNTPVEFADILKDTVPARAYGAKCNGVNNDSAAFAAAQAVAGSGTILWPAGTCILENVTPANFVTHQGAPNGKTIFLRKPGSQTNNFINSETGLHNFTMRDIVVDGNRQNNTLGSNNIQLTGGPYANTFERVTSRNAKKNGGYGSGYLVFDGADLANNTNTRLIGSSFSDNDGGGVEVQGGGAYIVDRSEASRNGATGFKWDKASFPPIVGNADNLVLTNNQASNNGVDGIMIAGFWTGGTPVRPIWGNGAPQARKASVTGNKASFNGRYGIAVQGDAHVVTSNQAWRNGGTPPGSGGGFLLNASNSTFSDNFAEDNAYYGLDAGGCDTSVIAANVIKNTGLSIGSDGFGINSGGGFNCIVQSNVLTNNRGTSIHAIGVEGAGPTSLFENNTYGAKISNNTITLPNATSAAIVVSEGADTVTVTDNDVYGAANGFAMFFQGGSSGGGLFNLRQRGNTDWSNGATGKTVASAGNLVLPDFGETFYVTGAEAIVFISTQSSNQFSSRVRWVVPTSHTVGQFNPDSLPAVSFSGGGCTTLPAGSAMISNSGAFMGVRFTEYGFGCTSAPALLVGGQSNIGLPQVGLNNFQDREITLHFYGAASINPGGNISTPGGAFTAAPGCQVQLRGAFGGWYVAGKTC